MAKSCEYVVFDDVIWEVFSKQILEWSEGAKLADLWGKWKIGDSLWEPKNIHRSIHVIIFKLESKYKEK